MINFNKFTRILLIALLLLPLAPEAQVLSEKGIGSMELQRLTCRNNRPSDQKVHLAAIEKAKLSAWSKYTAGFNSEKTEAYLKKENEFTNNLEDYITDYVVLDSDCSKSRRVYTISLRVSINGTKVDSVLVTGAGNSQIREDLKGKLVMYLIVPRDTDEADIFDARRTTQSETRKSLTADEMISESEGAVSITESSVQRESTTTGGKTKQKRTDRTYVIGDLTGAESQIADVLRKLGMRGMAASRLEMLAERDWGKSPFLKDIQDQFEGKIGDYGANISPRSREELIETVLTVGAGRIQYFMMGTVDASTPRTDPDTGAQKVDVTVNIQLYSIDDFIGAEVVSTVGPEIKTAFGETDVIAKTEALKKAFSESVSSLIFKL
tara:strand:- start:2473 stop:3612 length:1140 start_codon:yes stop_codon:yes gene_type:complete